MSRAVFPTALIVLAAASLAAPAGAQDAIVDRAKQARLAGRIDDSERALIGFLRTNPNHYRALYNLGLVHEARALRAPPGQQRAAHYRIAADYLERALKVRRSEEIDYTIYNSLGVMYLGVPDLAAAERSFAIGLQNQARLSQGSRAKLYSNVGYLFALKGDMPRAESLMKQASGMGSAPAATNLQKLQQAGLLDQR